MFNELITNIERSITQKEKIAIERKRQIFGKAFIELHEFYRCVPRALYRMIVVLNENKRNSPFYRKDLKSKSDTDIESYFKIKKLVGKKLSKYLTIRLDLAANDKISNDDLAENFFYGDLRVKVNPDDTISLEYIVTCGFYKFLYLGYRMPDTTKKITKEDVLRCNTNYLLRNLWHNYIHVVLHGWNNHNYHNFKGDCRTIADFEADNYSSILLTYSYGANPNAEQDTTHRRKIEKIFEENKCNQIFLLRNSNRRFQKLKNSIRNLADYQEVEWRYRRTLGSILIQELIKRGLCCTSFAIYSFDNINENPPWRIQDRLIFELNGRKYSYQHESNLPTYQDEKRNMFFNNIVSQIINDYALCMKNLQHKKYTNLLLNAFFVRIGLSE